MSAIVFKGTAVPWLIRITLLAEILAEDLVSDRIEDIMIACETVRLLDCKTVRL